MNVTTLAPPPDQPAESSYPGSALNLLRPFSRASYLASTGSDAPTYDGKRKPKYWKDDFVPGAPTDTVTYEFIDMSTPGKPVISTIQMSVSEARSVNLPGVHSYPTYVIAATGATETTSGTITDPLPAINLSLKSDAVALAESWGLDGSAVSDWSLSLGGPETFQWPDNEPRRPWVIAYGIYSLFAGEFLAAMAAAGVGSPGHWDFSANQPHWVSEVPAFVTVTLQPWPDPVRPLQSNEKLWSGLFGGVVAYRTDMTSNYNPAPSATAGGTLDTQVLDQATQANAGVAKLLAWFRVQ